MDGELTKYRPFIGREYEPPHGCLRLVEQVFHEAYEKGRDKVVGIDNGIPANSSRPLFELIQRLTYPVSPGDVQEGDIILVRSRPWHIGVVIDPKKRLMLHSYDGGAACIEQFIGPSWESRIAGFYRYVDVDD